MRRWGILISIFYALIVICLLLPAAIYLAGEDSKLPAIIRDMGKAAGEWLIWLPLLAVLGGQALLLFLSVDTSQKTPQASRAHFCFCCHHGDAARTAHHGDRALGGFGVQ